MIKKILMPVVAFFITLIVLWAALAAAAAVPNTAIYENMLASALSYGDKDAFMINGKMNCTEDNYADAILLNVAWNMGSESPFTSALDTKYCDGNDGINDYGENYGLFMAVTGTEPNTDYTRYWHGSALFIRLLMLVTDVEGIKLIGFISAAVLLGINVMLLIKRKQYFAAAALPLSLLCVQAYNIRLSLEYQPSVIVTLAVLIPFILFEKKENAINVLAAVSGTMIAFFDFLTAETLSVLVPLIIVFIIRKSEDRMGSLRTAMRNIALCCGIWLLSYAMTFVVKWTAASLVTGENKFRAALFSAQERFSGETDEMSFFTQLIFAPLSNLSVMFGSEGKISLACIVTGLLAAALLFGAAYRFFKGNPDKNFIYVMVFMAIIPFVRFLVLSNHSYLHSFFSYRALAASVLAAFSAVWFSLEFASGKPKKQRKAKRK